MAKFIIAFVCLTIVGYAFSLKCYHCKLGKDCMDIQNTDATECGKIADSTHESRCIKKIIEDNQTKKQNISRACVIYNPKKPNELCEHKDTNAKQITCEICNENLCNDSTNVKSNMFAIIGASLSIILAKYILY